MTGDTSLFDLSGRTAVVTGGNGGIGRAIALGLARAGASVAVLARNEEKNRRVLAELQRIGRPALVSRLDVTDRAALGPTLQQVERSIGGIDILVNNAGIVALTGGVLNETADIWDSTIETHLNACFLLSQLVAKSMVNRKNGGKIINLASVVSLKFAYKSAWSSQDSVDTISTSRECGLKLVGTNPAEVRVSTRSIVEGLDIVGDLLGR
jgi:2-dehydro-3-deoxy-D-gluconate 5-dehydrogenase